MDSFDWLEFLRGVEEFGHGAVSFYLKDENSNRLEEVKIDTVLINEEVEEVEVTLLRL